MTDLSQQTPSEIDTQLAELHEQLTRAQFSLARSERLLERDTERGATWNLEQRNEDVQADYERVQQVEMEMAPFHAEYERRGRWTRFFLVTNANGHIHTSMHCATCFPDTEFGWLPQYSGMTDEEIVERESYRACTVCLPIAPAEQQAARERHTREQREAKRAERETKKNEKLRKSAERAEKFLAKVEKQVVKSFGSWDKLWAEYSLHGHDGKKSLYDATFDMPAQVGNYLYDEMQAREDEARGQRFKSSRHFTEPQARPSRMPARRD
jgi:hypothetical protein